MSEFAKQATWTKTVGQNKNESVLGPKKYANNQQIG